MIGDKLIISDYHRRAASQAIEVIRPEFEQKGQKRIAISVSGESGCGKSETAEVLREKIAALGYKVIVLGQDDYFKLPPKSNAAYREKDINWVGPGEVHLDILDKNLEDIKNGATHITKPLVYFEDDRIDQERIEGGPFDIVIAEGTYTSLLNQIDFRVFIDRTYHQTKKHRLTRARDEAVGFIEKVLEIEHQIISKEKAKANVVIAPPPEEIKS